ncbi:MAG: arylsulfatase [Acidobacteriota bacterium]
MNRRNFLHTAALSALPPAAPARQPNIVWIMADDLGWGDLGCYGQKYIRTPHLDRLATQGLRFTDVYAGCTVCAPSRSVLMTGMHMGHTSVRSNPGGVPLLPSDLTVAEVLKKAGYTNGIFGKWGLGDIGTATTAIRKGFDEHVGFLHQAHAHFQFPRFIYQNDREYPLAGNSDTTHQTYANDVVAAKALDFIRRHRQRPFFAYLPLTVPHGGFHVPEDSLAAYRGKFPDGAPLSSENGRQAPQPEPRAAFAGMVSRLDGYVGQVLALLKELNLEQNTIVFFTSDNGGIRFSDNFFANTGPFRGQKGNLYEGGIRVPMIVRWPGRVPAGRVSSFPWAFQDVFPTLAQLAGVQPIPRCDGISVLPTLLGQAQAPHAELYWEFPRYQAKTGAFADEVPIQAMRRGYWKAVRPKPNAPVELYDLTADPAEQHDLAAAHPVLAATFDRDMKAARVPPRPQAEPAHPWWAARS